jgi:hypothetical protein
MAPPCASRTSPPECRDLTTSVGKKPEMTRDMNAEQTLTDNIDELPGSPRTIPNCFSQLCRREPISR